MLFIVVTIIVVLCASSHASRSCLQQRWKRSDTSSSNIYLVSGSNAGYFENYRFWDFTHLTNATSSNLSDNGEPPAISVGDDTGMENVTSSYFTTSTFAQEWELRTGIRNPDSNVPMIYSAQNVWISLDSSVLRNETSLAIRTTRLPKFQSMAEMRTTFDVLHASMRLRLKVVPNDDGSVPSGAVIGFFTYASDTQESDLEILTKDPLNQVRLTNQPAARNIPGSTLNVSLPNGKLCTDWIDYRLDWFADRTVWYAEDQMLYESNQSVPTNASALIMNLWSNGGSFSGIMDVGEEVKIAVHWIEMAYNTSAESASSSSEETPHLYNIDGVTTKGVPEAVPTSNGRRLDTIASVHCFGYFFLLYLLVVV